MLWRVASSRRTPDDELSFLIANVCIMARAFKLTITSKEALEHTVLSLKKERNKTDKMATTTREKNNDAYRPGTGISDNKS